ncbi:MAG TPA: zinc-ribbon domain containing protein [Phycisphaerae bacterium]|nr:zinc-ribbon domain containing protein [Phycisphaerae bacterium]
MSFEDKTIICADCGNDFIHSATDQERYAERGFTNEPKRCRDCREKRKSQSGGGGGGGGRGGHGGHGGGGYGGGGYGGGGYGGGRQEREMHEATCSQCGAQTTVPFKPTSGRPVLCRDCFRASRN